jgi:flavodoxin I
MKIAIFFGSTYGNTRDAAEQIGARLSKQLGVPVPVFDICLSKTKDLQEYDVLLIGCSTWNIGEMQDDWDRACDDLDRVDLAGKRFAVFGAGDQDNYPDSFQDALLAITEKFEARGALHFGSWPTDGYRHTASLGIRDGKFLGLALDYENQWDESAPRIAAWTDQIAAELQPQTAAV